MGYEYAGIAYEKQGEMLAVRRRRLPSLHARVGAELISRWEGWRLS